MLPMDVEAIKKIPISYINQSDLWSWHHKKTGVFPVRSAYRMIVETKLRCESYLDGSAEASNTEEEKQKWQKLWKVKVPSKLRIFAWRLARSSLPTGEVRERTGIWLPHRYVLSATLQQILGATPSSSAIWL